MKIQWKQYFDCVYSVPRIMTRENYGTTAIASLYSHFMDIDSAKTSSIAVD